MSAATPRVTVIGLGYVGLPLALVLIAAVFLPDGATLERTDRDGVYALRQTWPETGDWVIVITGAAVTTGATDHRPLSDQSGGASSLAPTWASSQSTMTGRFVVRIFRVRARIFARMAGCRAIKASSSDVFSSGANNFSAWSTSVARHASRIARARFSTVASSAACISMKATPGTR